MTKLVVDPEKLIEAGAHFGHQTRRWNPKMEEYLYGEENGIHIFDLMKTKELLENALDVIFKAGKEGKRIIFVGTKKQAKEKIKEVAKKTGQYYVSERWLGGILTNFDQMKRTLKQLSEMKEKKALGEYKSYTKRENLLIDRKIDRMERFFGGLMGIEKIPDMLVVVDIKKESGAIQEANKIGIETVAVVDTNCDPDDVTYEIPMNDDATKAVDYVLDLIAESYNNGVSDKGKTKKVEKKVVATKTESKK